MKIAIGLGVPLYLIVCGAYLYFEAGRVTVAHAARDLGSAAAWFLVFGFLAYKAARWVKQRTR